MTATARRDGIDAAMSVAEDIAAGKLDPAALTEQAVAELRQLAGTVTGPGDPLWDLQVQIARGVLAHGGLDATELAEWAAVARHREGGGEPAVDAPEPSEPVAAPDVPPEPETPASGEHSADTDLLPADDQPPRPPWAAPNGVDVPPPPPPRRGEYDPLRGWSPGDTLPRP